MMIIDLDLEDSHQANTGSPTINETEVVNSPKHSKSDNNLSGDSENEISVQDNEEDVEEYNEVQKPVDNSMQARKLFVGGIPWGVTNQFLRAHFEKFGEVEEARVMIARTTGRPRGFGFVVYKLVEDMTKVLTMEHTLDGKTVEVKKAIPRTRYYNRYGNNNSNHNNQNRSHYNHNNNSNNTNQGNMATNYHMNSNKNYKGNDQRMYYPNRDYMIDPSYAGFYQNQNMYPQYYPNPYMQPPYQGYYMPNQQQMMLNYGYPQYQQRYATSPIPQSDVQQATTMVNDGVDQNFAPVIEGKTNEGGVSEVNAAEN